MTLTTEAKYKELKCCCCNKSLKHKIGRCPIDKEFQQINAVY